MGNYETKKFGVNISGHFPSTTHSKSFFDNENGL